MKLHNVVLICLSLILSLSAVFYYFLEQERSSFKEEQARLTEAQAQAMQEELALLAEEYQKQYQKISIKGIEGGEIIIATDSLVDQLLRERAKVEELRRELAENKKTSSARILALSKEVGSLRKVLKSYVLQIDSLHSSNERLRAENKAVRANFERSQYKVAQLAEEKNELSSRVDLAAKLDATSIVVRPIDKKGKTAKKINKIASLEISFKVTKNVTAEVGLKTFYARIMQPDDEVMLKPNATTFIFDNKEIKASMSRELEYNGEELMVTMYWIVEESLLSGAYRLQIFADGNLIGTSNFTL